MGFSIKKFAEEATAQLNPFDHGKTAATVRAARPVQPAQLPPQGQRKPSFSVTNNSLTRGLSRAYDQVNPLDNGRTWQQTQPTNTLSAGTQFTQSAPFKVAKAIEAPNINATESGINLAKIGAGLITGNHEATQNALEGFKQNAVQHQKNLQAFVTRPVAETAATIVHPLSQATYHPGSRVEKAVFGDTPVQNIQKKVVNNYETHPNLPTPARFGLAGAEAVGSIIQDAPVVGVAAKAAKPAVVATTKLVPQAAVATTKLATKTGEAIDTHLTPKPYRITPEEHATLSDFSDMLSGQYTPDIPTINALHAAAHDIAKKNGLDVASGGRRDIAERVGQYLEDFDNHQRNVLQGGFLGGEKAVGFAGAQKNGKVFEGVDGKPRFEVGDQDAKIINPDGKTLGDTLDHPLLYTQYPELRNVKVAYDEYLNPGEASYNPRTNTIEYGEGGNNPATLLHETQHAIQEKEGFAKGGEVPEQVDAQEVIKRNPDYPKWQAELKQLNAQKLERDGQGPMNETRSQRAAREQRIYNLQRQMRKAESQEAMRQYGNLAGEAEARAVEKRIDMTPGERYVQDAETLYHGGDHTLDQFDVNKSHPSGLYGKAMYLTQDANRAKSYGSNVNELKLPKDARLVTSKEFEKRVSEITPTVEYGDPTLARAKAVEQLKKEGYHGVRETNKQNGNTVAIFDPSVLKKASPQSTFYNSLDVPKEDLIVRHGDGGVVNGKAMSVEQPKYQKQWKPHELMYLEQKARGAGRIDEANAYKKQLDDIYTNSVDETPTVAPRRETASPMQQDLQAAGIAPKPSTPRSAPRTGRNRVQESVNPRPLTDEQAASLPPNRTTDVELNSNRLATNDLQREDIADETRATIERMSNKDVEKIAKSAGLDTRTYSIQQTRQKIAEQLNVRRTAVDLLSKRDAALASGDERMSANLIKQAAEAGRISREQGTDLARQLQARRIVANELDTPAQRLFKLLDNAGVNPDVYAERLKNVNFEKPNEVIEAYRDLVPAKFSDWLDKYRYTNMLSSPMTHARNIIGNLTGSTVIRPVTKAVEGGLDAGRALLTRGERTRYAGEVGSYYKGMAGSLGDSARAFGEVWSGKRDFGNLDFDTMHNAPLAKGGVGGVADTALSFVTKLMESTDQFFTTAVKGGERRSLEYRSNKGVKINDIEGHAQDAADYTLFRKELGGSEQGHLLQAVDFIPQKVSEARRAKNPAISLPAKLIYPFVKTPVNVSKQMIEYSPLGIATIPGSADRTAQIAKAVIGTSGMAVAAGTLAASDRLTYAAPTDPKEKQKFLAEGRQAYSVKIGNKWVSYQYAHPAISFQLAAVAAVHDSLKNGKMDQSTADKVLTGLAQTSRFFIDQSYFKNSQDFLNNVQGTGSLGSQATTALASQGSNIVNQFVPARAAMSWLNNFIDKTQRQPDNSGSAFEQFKQQFSSQLPVLSQGVPARKDNLGNDLPKQNPTLNNFTPFKVSTEKADNNPKLDSLTNEVDRLARQDNGIALSKLGKVDKISGTSVNFNKDQVKTLDTKVQDQVKTSWNNLISTPEYQALNDEDKKHALKTAKSDATNAAKIQFADSQGVTLKDRPSTAVASILRGDINYSNYAKAKTADGTYNATTETYLDKYNAAQDDFKKNSAKWSTVERAKKENTRNYLAVQKDYDDDTVSLYGMSKARAYDLVANDPKGNGKALAAKMIAYGDALVNAGLIDQNKFRDKYGNVSIQPKAKGSGGSGSSRRNSNGISKAMNAYSLYGGSGGGGDALSFEKTLRNIVAQAHLSGAKKKLA